MMIRHTTSGSARRLLIAALVGCLWASSAGADIFHMKWGATIEGVVLEVSDDAYRVRTPVGVIDLDKEDVARIEKSPSPWQEYKRRSHAIPNTADAHYKLALWCEERGLPSKRVKHLKIAVQLDKDHAAARDALGFEKKDGDWIRKSMANAPTEEELEKRRREQEEEKLIQERIADWFVKVRAVHNGRLAKRPPGSKQFKAARDFILSIDDPLAVPAITSVLSTGNEPTRRVMIEALSQFDDDEATMNLIVAALLDPSSDIRREAAIELYERKDERIVDRLRQALWSDEEFVLRNAATALGLMRADAAFEDLVAVLSIEKLATVPITRPVLLGGIYTTFGGGCRLRCGGRFIRYWPRRIGCMVDGSMIGTVTHYETHYMSIFRTEVQEALIAISGQNFGFDENEWLDWWRFNKPAAG